MTRLGILVALPGEAAPLRPPRRVMGETVALAPDVLLRVSGAGAARAREAAAALAAEGATHLASWGSAGGLDPELEPGALVLASEAISPGGERFAADARWRDELALALGAFAPAGDGAVVESGRPVATVADKRALLERTGARIVDMESASIAAVARERGVAFLAVRAVSDPAGGCLPPSVLRAVDAAGHVRPHRLALALLRRPADLPSIARLDRGFRAAARTLATVWSVAGARLLGARPGDSR